MELREYREREDIMAPKVIRASKDSMEPRGYKGNRVFRVIRVRMVLKAFRGTQELMAIHGTQVLVHQGRG